MIAEFFGFDRGYIFSFWTKQNKYNKTNTRNIILESTGIDIFSNPEFNMSQERCIRKIWDEFDDYTNGKLLKVMLDFYVSKSSDELDSSEYNTYKKLCSLQERLLKSTLTFPVTNNDSLEIIRQDIERNISNDTPEMAIDRLHTFCVMYFKGLCDKHQILVTPDSNGHYSLTHLIGELNKWYNDNDYFDSDFSKTAIRNSSSLFDKFNFLRNNRSPAHDNEFMFKIEAEYVVKIITDTVMFIEKLESAKNGNSNETLNEDAPPIFFDDDLPF